MGISENPKTLIGLSSILRQVFRVKARVFRNGLFVVFTSEFQAPLQVEGSLNHPAQDLNPKSQTLNPKPYTLNPKP